MRGARKVFQKLLTEADFPGEIITGVPVVEIKGDSEASVIHHRGLIAYDPAEIRVGSALGPVVLIGEAMTIFRMNRERITVHGTVYQVQLGAASC